jgi:hypothetical protein
MDEKRSPRIRRFESGRDPSTDRVLMRSDEDAQLADRVAVMEFDAAAVKPPCHVSFSRIDQNADVLDPPCGGAGPELNRAWKATGLNTGPPR